MSLFWRVFAANAAILTAGALVLAFALGPLHKYGGLIDLGGLQLGLLVMLVVNGVLLRRLFGPLEHLAGRMEAADVLGGGQRVPAAGSGRSARSNGLSTGCFSDWKASAAPPPRMP